MALNLAHDAAFHTNGRLGMLFAQTEILVYEVREISGNVTIEKEIAGSVELSGVTTGSICTTTTICP